MAYFNGFGQLPDTCRDKAQALTVAQGEVASEQSKMASGFPNNFPNAQANLIQSQQALQQCIANPPPTGAQQFQQVATGAGAFIGATAPLVGGLLSILGKQPKVPTGPQTVYIPPQQSNTGLIIGVAAAAVILVLVVVMMKK